MEKKKKKREEIRAKYDPEIADLRSQIAREEAEAERLRAKIQRVVDSGGRPSAMEVKSLKTIMGGIKTREMMALKLENDKRIELLAIDIGTSVEELNRQLEKLAEQMELSMEDESERLQIIDAFEQQVAAMSPEIGVSTSSTAVSDAELEALGIRVPGSGSKAKDRTEDTEEERERARERESLFE